MEQCAIIVPGAVAHDGTRLSRAVMHSLLQDVRQGRYAAGSRLPPERELARAFGVSRPVVREALLALDVLGLVETRVGSGSYVAERMPDAGLATPAAFAAPVSPFELLDVLGTLECTALRHAADLIDDEAIDRLAALVPAPAQLTPDLEHRSIEQANFEHWHDAVHTFHARLATCAQESITGTLVRQLWSLRRTDGDTLRLLRKAWSAQVLPACASLHAILDALRGRDTEAACAALRQIHLDTFEAVVETYAEEEMGKARRSVSSLRARFAQGAAAG